MNLPLVMGIETSCDDTSVALVDQSGYVVGLKSAHQNAAHRPFGGVVPEVASRQHTENLLPLVDDLMNETGTGWGDVGAVAVTSRPGLIGSLLVGVVTAKTIALLKHKKLIGVNHIEGHLVAPLLRDSDYQPPDGFDFPYVGLAVSGGHTHLFRVEGPGRLHLLGRTVDDAAGEAFDKLAKMLRLGFPGGVFVDQTARTGNPKAYRFPRGMMHEKHLNFSFSGLKTAAQREIATLSPEQLEFAKADLCASYQEAIVEVLLYKLDKAMTAMRLKNVTISGGVSANSALRERATEWARAQGYTLALPPLKYCTDNAAMIAEAGVLHSQAGHFADQELSPSARALDGDFLST